jgi:uncharacterized protein YecE (DUF72 family)
MARIHIGTSGWQYRHWRGTFYPERVKGVALLPFYARHFRSVEVNTTFYRLARPGAAARWRQQVPSDFVFACKGSRFITHMKKLKDPETSLPRFLAAIAGLGEKLGPILFQLPPRWGPDLERLDAFLAALPPGHRYAFELRDEGWIVPATLDLLARRNAAFCAYDIAGRQSPVETTADFAYVRLHGPGAAYQGSYDDRVLEGWAERLEAWRAGGRDAYCYFDNDEKAYAVQDALRLQQLLGREPPE